MDADLVPPMTHPRGNGAEPPRALYIHLPFCVRRCAYCDFPTEAADRNDPAIDAYVDKLCLDLRRRAKAGELAAIETIYIGGGTPTHIGARRLTELLYMIGVSLALEGVEMTVEANPESLTPELVRDLYALGVNRLSLGVQSFDDAVLATLGRAHDAAAARRAVDAALSRFANVSVDLMAAIPGQTAESLLESVAAAVDTGVSHLSVYPLSVEPNTVMEARVRSGELELWDEDSQAEALEAVSAELRARGFSRYEVASFARPGFTCAHNQAYWSGVPYLGLGRAAVTMRQGPGWRERVRDGVVIERLDARQMLAEDLMLAMRTTAGISADLQARARAVFPAADAVFDDLVALGLAERRADALAPTERGFLLGNEIYGRLLELAP